MGETGIRRSLLSCHIRKMLKEDIPQVSQIDREAFPTMWPPVNFQHEMTNRLAHYIVAWDGIKANPLPEETAPVVRPDPGRSFWGFRLPFFSRSKNSDVLTPVRNEAVLGFVGMWIMVDEAHIINIAVREANRGKGIGELLLISSIDKAYSLNASFVTLEVRVSNKLAQNLYNKYGFKQTGLRKKYYTDNNEDAFIMTTDMLSSESYSQRFQKLKESHFEKLKDIDYQI